MVRNAFEAKGTPVLGATKIVVHIEGGCLRSVHADGPLKVELLDQDEFEGDSTNVFEEKFDAAVVGLEEVW
jgi:hypothetical protein